MTRATGAAPAEAGSANYLPRRQRGRPRNPKVRAEIEALAEAVAEGAVSVAAAGRVMGLSEVRAVKHWQAIRRELGPQAA